MKEVQILSLVCFGMAAVLSDLQTGKIPNSLIVTGLICGMIYQCMKNGIIGMFLFLGGCILPVLLLWILFCYRMIGAGDIKLFCLIGGYTGPTDCFYCILLAVLFGGIISLFLMIRYRNIGKRLVYFGTYISDCSKGKKWRPYKNNVEEHARFCFSIPVFIGILGYIVRDYL